MRPGLGATRINGTREGVPECSAGAGRGPGPKWDLLKWDLLKWNLVEYVELRGFLLIVHWASCGLLDLVRWVFAPLTVGRCGGWPIGGAVGFEGEADLFVFRGFAPFPFAGFDDVTVECGSVRLT